MANKTHLAKLEMGMDYWNEWIRVQRTAVTLPTHHEGAKVGVSGFFADLRDADLHEQKLNQTKAGSAHGGIDLVGADLRNANLRSANLAWANLSAATLAGADLRNANLMNARFDGANVAGVDLTGALLGGANLLSANFTGSKFDNTYLYETSFSDTNLSLVTGLERCKYAGPCTVDFRTVFDYGQLPNEFLRGCGLPETLITYIPSLAGNAIHYSCFISYSSKDDEFAQKLYLSLQNYGIRCWFAPHDLPIGAKTWDSIDDAIQIQDKLLLVLSNNSIASDWVEDEVSKAFAEERSRGRIVLFPIRIDDEVMKTAEPWVAKLRDQRNIGDCKNWRDSQMFDLALKRIIRDLQRK